MQEGPSQTDFIIRCPGRNRAPCKPVKDAASEPTSQSTAPRASIPEEKAHPGEGTAANVSSAATAAQPPRAPHSREAGAPMGKG